MEGGAKLRDTPRVKIVRNTYPHQTQRGRSDPCLGLRLSAHSAKDGSIFCGSCAGFNPKQKKNWVVVGSQVVAGEVAVVPYGRGTHLAGIKLGGKGDVTDTHRMDAD